MTEFQPLERSGGLRFTITSCDAVRAVSVMEADPQALNPYGVIQAGAMIWLADVTATVLCRGPATVPTRGEKGFPLSVQISTSLVGNQAGGRVSAEARWVHKGRRLMVVRTKVTGEKGNVLAEVTTTHIPA